MRDFVQAYLQTLQDIVSNSAIFTTLILSVVFYSFFYPTAYKAEQATHLPIVIVDEEQSIISQQIVTEVAKSPKVQIVHVISNFAEAENLVKQQKADAILLLPFNLSQSLARGEVGGVGLYLNATNFLKTKQIGSGLAGSIEHAIEQQLQRFKEYSHFSPQVPIHQIPLFNVYSGYGSYIFPAISPLIIHQTLFIGLGMLIAGYRVQNKRMNKASFIGCYMAALSIGCLGCYYLFGFSFWLYDYPRGGNFWTMLIAVPIFISAVVGLSILLASYLDVPERAGHIMVFSSIPLLLLSGVAWPHAAMPSLLANFGQILPSTQGIQLFIQLNQMGVPFLDVSNKLAYLLIIAVITTFWAYKRLSTMNKS